MLATPKEVGPTSRMPWRRQMASSRRGPRRPGRNAVTTRALTPRCPQSSAISVTAAAGVAMTASSTGSGSAATDGLQVTPPGRAVAQLVGPGVDRVERPGEAAPR